MQDPGLGIHHHHHSLSAQINDHQFWLLEGMKFTVDGRMLVSQRPQVQMLVRRLRVPAAVSQEPRDRSEAAD
jgi:hypothetical protein